MVSIRQTAKKYHGRKAATYDEIREKQARWHMEHEVVGRWLGELKPSSVLDCPVGTGRFLSLYYQYSVMTVLGIDISSEMLELARRKIPTRMKRIASVTFKIGDATDLTHGSGQDNTSYDADVVVCVRFLDLIDEAAMVAVVKELCRVARRAVILTIRLGSEYIPKSNTSEHDTKKFYALVKKLGWKVEESVPFRDAGWHIMKLGRVK